MLIPLVLWFCFSSSSESEIDLGTVDGTDTEDEEEEFSVSLYGNIAFRFLSLNFFLVFFLKKFKYFF
jgi:hypothetical protein